MRAILVSVDYADLLAITLPYNRHHFHSVMVVTSSADTESQRIAAAHEAQLHVTDAFYDDGAVFNKWKALEQGLDAFGRQGWLCLMDADILWPKKRPATAFRRGCLYTPRRRILHNVPTWQAAHWRSLPLKNESEFAGYSQIFHAEDPHLGPAPWHEINWRHAGGADSFFQQKWPDNHKIRPPFEVLHLGDPGQNWCGRATPYLDGSKHPDADARVAQLQDFRASRTKGPDRFNAEKLPG